MRKRDEDANGMDDHVDLAGQFFDRKRTPQQCLVNPALTDLLRDVAIALAYEAQLDPADRSGEVFSDPQASNRVCGLDNVVLCHEAIVATSSRRRTRSPRRLPIGLGRLSS